MKVLGTALLVVFLAAFACGANADGPAPGTVVGRGVDSVKRLAALWESAKDQDPAVRQAAVRSLGELGDKAATPVLTEVLSKDQDEQVRLAALGALVMSDNQNALPAYVRALKDESEKVRQSAAQALSGLWDEKAQKALIEALAGDPSPKVRRSAAEALGNPGIMGKTGAHHWDSQGDSEAALILALQTDASYEVRATAAQTLGVFQSERSVEPLIQAIDKDASNAVRAAATESLGTMTDKPRAVDRLVDVLDFERDDTVVINAMKALKFTQDPRVLEPV